MNFIQCKNQMKTIIKASNYPIYKSKLMIIWIDYISLINYNWKKKKACWSNKNRWRLFDWFEFGYDSSMPHDYFELLKSLISKMQCIEILQQNYRNYRHVRLRLWYRCEILNVINIESVHCGWFRWLTAFIIFSLLFSFFIRTHFFMRKKNSFQFNAMHTCLGNCSCEYSKLTA